VLLIAIPVAVLIGLSLGALGGGGSILTVPALVFLLGQDAHTATTGSLIIVGITALIGMVAHERAGHVRALQGSLFAMVGLAGTYAGSRLSDGVDPQLLLALFSVVMVVAATAMLLRRPCNERLSSPATATASARVADRIPVRASSHVDRYGCRRADRHEAPVSARARPYGPAANAALIVSTATGVGLVTGFFGVGGGFVVVPALVLALGYDMPVAVGTSLLVIAVNSAAALASRAGQHVSLDWPLLAVFAAFAGLGSVAGRSVSLHVAPGRLTVGFAALLYTVAAYTAVRSGAHLL
jgi:uncharacterized protein